MFPSCYNSVMRDLVVLFILSIAKSGDGYLARRENEPTLYQLDSSTVGALQKAADDIKPAATPSW